MCFFSLHSFFCPFLSDCLSTFSLSFHWFLHSRVLNTLCCHSVVFLFIVLVFCVNCFFYFLHICVSFNLSVSFLASVSDGLCVSVCLPPPPPPPPLPAPPPWEREVPGSNPASAGIFSVATLPGAWRYRVSTGTGRPGVSILWLGEMESLICSFYLSVAARKFVCADPSLRYTRMLLGR